MTSSAVIEPDDIGAARRRRWFSLAGLAFGCVFFGGVAWGIAAKQGERADPWEVGVVAAMACAVLAALASAWLLVRRARQRTGEEGLNRRERLNRNILVGALLLGVGSSVLISTLDPSLADGKMLSDAPLPPGIAIIMMLMAGVFGPAMSLYWHRSAIDEVEADAYKTAAVWALYVFMCGAPTWWFAWRGGFAPAPDGLTIYFVTIFTVLIIWSWKKFR